MNDLSYPEVPLGSYCYSELACPHMTTKEVEGIAVPWCNLLKAGSIPGNIGDDNWEKLEKYFDGKIEPDLSLFLLWDACKECGVSNSDFECDPHGHPDFAYRSVFVATAEGMNDCELWIRVSRRLTPREQMREAARQIRRFPKHLERIASTAKLVAPKVGHDGAHFSLSSEGDIVRLAADVVRWISRNRGNLQGGLMSR